MKKIIKEHSLYIVIFTIIEIIFAILAILAFVYEDKIDLSAFSNVSKLIETLYSQTWWGLVLLSIGLASIFSLTSIIYKKLDYYFISIAIWVMLTILAINLNDKIIGSLKTLLLLLPIIAIKIICYYQEKNKINNKKIKKKVKNN